MNKISLPKSFYILPIIVASAGSICKLTELRLPDIVLFGAYGGIILACLYGAFFTESTSAARTNLTVMALSGAVCLFALNSYSLKESSKYVFLTGNILIIIQSFRGFSFYSQNQAEPKILPEQKPLELKKISIMSWTFLVLTFALCLPFLYAAISGNGLYLSLCCGGMLFLLIMLFVVMKKQHSLVFKPEEGQILLSILVLTAYLVIGLFVDFDLDVQQRLSEIAFIFAVTPFVAVAYKAGKLTDDKPKNK